MLVAAQRAQSVLSRAGGKKGYFVLQQLRRVDSGRRNAEKSAVSLAVAVRVRSCTSRAPVSQSVSRLEQRKDVSDGTNEMIDALSLFACSVTTLNDRCRP